MNLTKPQLPLVLVVLIAVVAASAVLLIQSSEEEKVCAADAKICPDGTAVGRVLPDCDFAPCPVLTSCKEDNDCVFNPRVGNSCCIKGTDICSEPRLYEPLPPNYKCDPAECVCESGSCEYALNCYLSTECGDGVCDPIETCDNCPEDCDTCPVGCPEDARICPDGSTVVRVPPDCEFEECPLGNASNASQQNATPPDLPGIEVCWETTNPERRGECIIELAKEKKDSRYCSAAGTYVEPARDWEDRCLLEVVKLTRDIGDCEVDQWTLSYDCMLWVLEYETDPGECLKLDQLKKYCIEKLTVRSGDYTYCSYLEEKDIDYCYYRVGTEAHINESCQQISDGNESLREICNQTVSRYMSRLGDCADNAQVEDMTDCIKEFMENAPAESKHCDWYIEDTTKNLICKAVVNRDSSYCRDITIIPTVELCIVNCC